MKRASMTGNQNALKLHHGLECDSRAECKIPRKLKARMVRAASRAHAEGGGKGIKLADWMREAFEEKCEREGV